jgi:aryl-alcohol dehydrogenase-like predicted oxidoreductase
VADRREFLKAVGVTTLAAAFPGVRAESRMAMRAIPGTDESLSAVALGNSQAFRQGDEETSRRLLNIYFERGGRYVDCSGDGALLVGRLARELGFGVDAFLGAYFSAERADESRRAAQALLEATGKRKLDLMHTYPEDGVPHWDNLRRFKDEGLTRYIGLARHRPEFYDMMIKVMETGTLDFLQVNLSPIETEAEERILPMALDAGVAVTINRPFMNGEYFSIVKDKPLPGWAEEFDCESWAQFSLKYVLSHPAVTSVLTETANPRHAVDNLGAGSGRLPDTTTRVRMRDLIRSFV